MRLIATLIFTAALAVALPEPAKTTKTSVPFCSKLVKPTCHAPGKKYCSSAFISTTTTTATATGGGGATVATFPPDFPCFAQNAKVKREPAASPTTTPQVPPCLRKVVQASGSAALTSACSCLGITSSTKTVTVATAATGAGSSSATPTATADATKFIMQDGSTGNYGLEVSGAGFTGTETSFNATEQNAPFFSLDSSCYLHDTNGNMAYSDPSIDTDDVYWYTASNAPSSVKPITCGLSGNNPENLNMQCLSGSSIYSAFDPDTGAWELTGNYRANLFSIYVTPYA